MSIKLKFIYKITSPNNKVYIGKSVSTKQNKINYYKRFENSNNSNRHIANAIKKYKWNNMIFEIIEESSDWTLSELNNREIYWIQFYDSYNTGYNMTHGGDGMDPITARKIMIKYHKFLADDKRIERSNNCSIGQKKRFIDNPETDETKQKKRASHNLHYIIESPDGRRWDTTLSLREFAETFSNEIQISYWSLFNAYRKMYENKPIIHESRHKNKWKVTRVDS